MSLALVQESAKEVRRLAIAGSALAVNDFRIKKLIPPLEQAGAKVPVFGQIAKAMNELVNGTEAESAARLLALSTLLNAILYTQGETDAGGGFSAMECSPPNCVTTRTPARALKPLIAALTSAGAGRLEVLRSACERGAFNDLRLIDPAIVALGDSYAEIGDLVAEKILPVYGAGIVARLKAGLDLKGKKSDARRLKVLHRLDPASALELCETALDDGSADVKAAAIECLGQHEECLPLVLEQTNSKNKMLRAAALEALAGYDRPEVVTLFSELIKGPALDILARPFRALRSRQVLNSLLAEGGRVFDLLLKNDQEQIVRFVEILECLKGRKEKEAEDFLLNCFSHCEQLAKLKVPTKSPVVVQFSGGDLADRLVGNLFEIGSPNCLEAILAKRDVLPLTSFNQVLHSALRVWPPEKVYQSFAWLLAEQKGAGKQKADILQQTIRVATRGYVSGDFMERGPDLPETQWLSALQWDPRWLDAAIKADQQLAVCCLARPGHKGAIDYLSKAQDAKGQFQSGLVIRALARCESPKATDKFLELVEMKTKGARYLDYDLQLLLQSARYLPAADLPKLDAFAARLDEKFVDKYLEALAPLRPARVEPSENT